MTASMSSIAQQTDSGIMATEHQRLKEPSHVYIIHEDNPDQLFEFQSMA
jgi:hypothetical protein